jgi:hypothetical protein
MTRETRWSICHKALTPIPVVMEEDDEASSYSTRLSEEGRSSSFSDSFLLKLINIKTSHLI